MNEKIKQLLEERKKIEDKLEGLMKKYQDAGDDDEYTWGGHDQPQALQIESEKYLFDAAIREIDKELNKLGYKK
jgi:uncharacterized coiled-coil DUF342 family protein